MQWRPRGRVWDHRAFFHARGPMRRLLYLLANLLGGLVLILLVLNPTRPLMPVFGLLGLAVGCVVLARRIRTRGGDR
jgi:hypothetical protein